MIILLNPLRNVGEFLHQIRNNQLDESRILDSFLFLKHIIHKVPPKKISIINICLVDYSMKQLKNVDLGLIMARLWMLVGATNRFSEVSTGTQQEHRQLQLMHI
ncbi:hypothetical protein Tco_1462257 [Tanacetum coccineum]